MPWDDAAQLESDLIRALNSFDWHQADAACEEIVGRVAADAEPLPENSARRMLGALRRKGRFAAMTRLAEALLQSGLRTAVVRRQYAQSLIEQGKFYQAERELQSIIQDAASTAGEKAEAKGLLGRHYKQLYVNADDPSSSRNRAHLERALNEYLEGYRLDPARHYWHGINVVALTERARRDGLPTDGLPNPRTLAEAIIATLDAREAENETVHAFDEATRMEAYVALGKDKEALATARRYVDHREADAFELRSTIRQLREVWQLGEEKAPGARLLPLLNSAYLEAVGGVVEFDAKKLARESAAAAKAEADKEFEAVLGTTRMHKFRWYRKGLAQCGAVARIERRDGTGIGTGWLVKAGDFFPGWTGVLVLTNDHVVSAPREDGRPPHPRSIRPDDAQVNFQALGEVYDVESVVRSSYYKDELDYAFLRLSGDGVPKAEPLALYASLMAMAEPPPRMYIIGHPDGRDLEIALQDNFLIACNERLLHYRTPTEAGTSGSPVFEPVDWRVVALHHKGSKTLKRLDGTEQTYEANEGVAIISIMADTARAALPPPATPPGGTPKEVRQPF